MSTLTSFNSPSAASILGRTSAQLRPRFPLPSGGMAIDRILFSAMTRFKSSRPFSIQTIFESPRQCSLVGKLLNPFWTDQCLTLGDEHMADLDFLLLTGRLVHLEVLWKRLLEHQGNALSHHTDSVDGVDQRLDLGVEKIAALKFDHQKYQSGILTTFMVCLRLAN